VTSNIVIWDRILRIDVSLALISLVFVGPQTLWGLLGVIPLVTGLARFCPAYRVAGVSTCGHDRC
jgi:cadmium resistance protein CadD (predicted permease)